MPGVPYPEYEAVRLMRRVLNHIPRAPQASRATPLRAAVVAACRLLRAPLWLVAAWLRGAPGLAMHLRGSWLGLQLLARRRTRLPRGFAASLLLGPMDSVRYFEFDFAWASARDVPRGGRVLDVGSPRLFTVLLLRARRDLTADLVNPDARDLAVTRELLEDAGLASRSALHAQRIQEATHLAGGYDLVTCVSVLEHIPAADASRALGALWSRVRGGGRLVLTLPCAAVGFEEYIDYDEYGLGAPDDHGYVFGQRFYDAEGLERSIFGPLGRPARMEVFGELREGSFLVDRARKMMGDHSPEREPFVMATQWSRFPSPRELPGWGVVALEFAKPGA